MKVEQISGAAQVQIVVDRKARARYLPRTYIRGGRDKFSDDRPWICRVGGFCTLEKMAWNGGMGGPWSGAWGLIDGGRMDALGGAAHPSWPWKAQVREVQISPAHFMGRRVGRLVALRGSAGRLSCHFCLVYPQQRLVGILGLRTLARIADIRNDLSIISLLKISVTLADGAVGVHASACPPAGKRP